MKTIISAFLLLCASLFFIPSATAEEIDFSGIYQPCGYRVDASGVEQRYCYDDYVTVNRNGGVYLAVDISRNTGFLIALSFMTRTDTQQPPLEEFAVVFTDSVSGTTTLGEVTAFKSIYPLLPYPRTTMVKDMTDSPLYGVPPARNARFTKLKDGRIRFCVSSGFGIGEEEQDLSRCYDKVF